MPMTKTINSYLSLDHSKVRDGTLQYCISQVYQPASVVFVRNEMAKESSRNRAPAAAAAAASGLSIHRERTDDQEA